MGEPGSRDERYEGEGGRDSAGSGGRRPRGRDDHRGDGRGLRGASSGRGGRSAGARLPEELRALGRSLDASAGGGDELGAETMAERVLGRILAERVPVPVPEPPGVVERLRAVRRWTRLRRRSLTAGLCGLLAVLVLTPPVRAAVSDWFGFGGVEVRYDPSAAPSPGARVPDCGRSLSLGDAAHRAGFAPLMPAALGVPDAVTVSGERRERSVVGLCWRERGRTVRLDEFRAALDPVFMKTVREQPQWVPLSGEPSADGATEYALWFPRPHRLGVRLVDADGHRFTREQRTAGPTLLWMRWTGTVQVTLRLEGVASQAEAVRIARSLGGATSGADSGAGEGSAGSRSSSE
ncbi:hypothetical protein [Streptomyces sp. NPDC048521]|uniref:hypothetical protein n=1 Tax=Streptomyces sp. NPDC048521 TaxID=3365566 RepID=UPI003713EDE6